MVDDDAGERAQVARLRAELAEVGVVPERTSDLMATDPSARLIAVMLAQRECETPLPLDLLDVLVSYGDLMHFVGVRREQERPDSQPPSDC